MIKKWQIVDENKLEIYLMRMICELQAGIT